MPEDIAEGTIKSQIYRARGKNNLIYPNPLLSPENTETLDNINLTETGTARKRFGYAKFNSSQSTGGKDFTGLAQLPFKSGTEQAEFAGTAFYEDDGATRTARTGSLSLTDNTDLRWRIVFLQDNMIATNGTDETVRWTGSGNATDLTSSSNVPWTTCKDLVVHRNNLIALRPTESSVDHTTRVRWCDINPRLYTVDITNFPVDNRVEIYDQGAPIVGGVDFRNMLYVFKEDGFYQTQLQYDTGFLELNILDTVQGLEPIAINSITTQVGNPSFIWVVCRDGAYVVSPDNTFRRVTAPLDSDWALLNQGRLQYAVSTIYQPGHQVWTLLSSESNSVGHDRVLVWDWETNDIRIDTLSEAQNYIDSWVITDKRYIMFGSADGYVHKANDSAYSQDNGNDIDWDLKFAPNDLGMPGRSKNIINLITYYRSKAGIQSIVHNVIRDEGRSLPRNTNLTLGTSLVWNGAGLKWDNGLQWPGGTNERASFFVNRTAETIQPQWTGTGDFEFQGYQAEFQVIE